MEIYILLKKLEETKDINFDKFDLDEIKKILDKSIITKYIYLKLKNCDKINAVFNFFPKEFASAIYLLAVRR